MWPKVKSTELDTERLVMVLTLDRRKMLERVMIGDEGFVKDVLEGRTYPTLVYDCERPLGQFLLDHEAQEKTDWNLYGLSELSAALRFGKERARHEERGKTYLEGKARSENAVEVYAACKCLGYYWENKTAIGFEDRARSFDNDAVDQTKSFSCKLLTHLKNHSMDTLLERVRMHMINNNFMDDTELTIWYPWQKNKVECVVIRQNFLPAIVYYLQRLRDWGFCYCYCRQCGKWFLATSRHHTLCSDECRLKQNRENKQSHDAAVSEKQQEKAYKNCYQRLNGKMKKFAASGAGEEKIEEAKRAFAQFRKEANARKKKIETQKEVAEYQNWLFAAERECETYFE